MALASRSADEFFADGCPQRAAAISYYSLFALFPMAILIVIGFGIVIAHGDVRAQVIGFLLDNLPLRRGAGRADLRDLLDGVTRDTTAFGVLGIAGLVFSASGLMTAIRFALNDAFDRSADSRPPLTAKALDVALVVIAGFFAAASLALTVAMKLVANIGGRNGGLGARVVRIAVDVGEVLLPLAIAVAVFLFLYRVVPTGRTRLGDVWPGALVAGVGYELAKAGFSFYLARFGDYSAVYGSLGAVIAFVFFIFVASNVFLFGAEVASEWPGVRNESESELCGGSDRPLSARLRALFIRDQGSD